MKRVAAYIGYGSVMPVIASRLKAVWDIAGILTPQIHAFSHKIWEMYDLRAMRWTQIGPIDEKCAIVELDSDIYTLVDLRTHTAVRVYDPNSLAWTELAPMGPARSGFETVVMGGCMYVLGGEHRMHGLSSVKMYDPRTGVWQRLPRMQNARFSFQALVVNNSIYVCGGKRRSDTCALREIEKYDPNLGVWKELAPMEIGRAAFQAVMLHDIIYVLGGVGDGGITLREAEMYDTEANRWTRLPLMPTARAHFKADVVDGCIYAHGGRSGLDERSQPNLVSSLDRYDLQSGVWTQLKPMQTARYGHASVVVWNCIYIFGGLGRASIYCKSLEKYSSTTGRWTTLPSMRGFRVHETFVRKALADIS